MTTTITAPDTQLQSLQTRKAQSQQAIATIEAEIINLDTQLENSIGQFSDLSTEAKSAELDRQQQIVESRKSKQAALAQQRAKLDTITRSIMDCLTEQTRVEAMSDAERAKFNATLERVRENKESIAQLEPKAHDLEEQINDAVSVLADAIPEWRSVVNEINRAHGTCHSLLPDQYEKHRYSSDSIEELKLPTIKLYSHSSFTVQIDRCKI